LKIFYVLHDSLIKLIIIFVSTVRLIGL